MVSKADVRKLVDSVEATYAKCWNTLVGMKTPGSANAESMLTFQTRLASTLRDLGIMYRRIQQEKRDRVAHKDRLSLDWFKQRMSRLQDYEEGIKHVIAIGKYIGDQFAWFFYRNERSYLTKHYAHDRIFHAPPNIGGLGELEFIRNVPRIEGHLVVYHGATTFLRLGDISLIELRDGFQLKAVGELKTKQAREGELTVDLTLLGPDEESVAFLDQLRDKARRRDTDDSPGEPLDDRMRDRLRRQVAEIGRSFRTVESRVSAELVADDHVDELEAIWKSTGSRSFTYRRLGDGLVLASCRNQKRSLYSKFFTESSVDWNEKLVGVEKEVLATIAKDESRNVVWMGPFHNPDPDYYLRPGTTPMFWWPVDTDLVRELAFHDTLLMSVYNPVHLVRKLRDAGFTVDYDSGQQSTFRISKRINGRPLTFGGINAFIDLIVRQFVAEDTVVDILSTAADTIGAENVSPGTRLPIDLQHVVF